MDEIDHGFPGSQQGRVLIWGTTISFQDAKERFTDFFLNYGRDKGNSVYPDLLAQLHVKKEFELNINCENLLGFDRRLYENTVKYPSQVIPIMDLVVHEIYSDMYPGVELSRRFQVRLFNLHQKKSLRSLGPEEIEKLVAVRGMVIRVSPIIPNMRQAHFSCVACKHVELADVDARSFITEPSRCPRCQAYQSMNLIHNRCIFADKQVVRLQETPESIPEGQTPQTVSMFAFDSLVDVGHPGDRVEITGILRVGTVRANPRQRTVKAVCRTYMDIIHMKKSEKSRLRVEDSHADPTSEFHTSFDEEDIVDSQRNERIRMLKELGSSPDIYEKLTRSLAPSIWEMDDIKKGLLCQLFGGTNKEFANGMQRFRGEINVLLVGDPGTSKSQLLSFVHKIAPRGVYTSGKGSSAVGLTASVSRDPESNDTMLESGALVLSDRGVCCIDEFDKMTDYTRAVLHEAMEQQTVSIAKAGIIATLNARTAVLASANPRDSRYNPNLSVVDNIQLPPTLLSRHEIVLFGVYPPIVDPRTRFDLIYLVLDKPDESSDRRLARHITSLYWSNQEQPTCVLSLEMLTEYISFAKRNCSPRLSDEAKGDLIQGYVELRQVGSKDGRRTITATPRQLESIIRLAEAHARMRLSPTVLRSDVQEALRLVRVAIQQAAIDPRTGTVDMDLISTGRSAAARTAIEQLSQTVRGFLSSGSAKGQSFWHLPSLLEVLKELTSAIVSPTELQEALLALKRDGFIDMSPSFGNIRLMSGL